MTTVSAVKFMRTSTMDANPQASLKYVNFVNFVRSVDLVNFIMIITLI